MVKKTQKAKPELLAPAGNLDILKVAFMYGADAVYCGTAKFGMRNRVGFDIASLKKGIEYARKLNKKIYVTINTFPHSAEIAKLKVYIEKIVKLRPDALIVADPGVVSYIKENYDIPIHLSTQANTTNQLSASFWQGQGVERIVLARELSLKDISLISKETSVPIETFVHGAMCMAYSGRCQISNYFTNRDPNKGACIQSCRFKYKIYGLEEELRPKEIYPIYEDEEGSYILNSKDLCMIEHIDNLLKAGITSFKVEGRLKTEYYVATVIKAYRQAIDLYIENPEKYHKIKAKFKKELAKTSSRGFTTGFYFHTANNDTNNYISSRAVSSYGYIGRVIEYDPKTGTLTFVCKNYLSLKSKIEIVTPSDLYKETLKGMKRNGENIAESHADNIITTTIKKNLSISKDAFIRIKL